MMRTGFRSGYWVVEWADEFDPNFADLLPRFPEMVRGHRVAIASCHIYIRKKATDSFHNTDLQAVLQARGVSKLAICWLQSDFCVDTTTRRALALGYPVTLVADTHSTVDNRVLSATQISAHHNETLANITSFGRRVTVTPAEQVQFEA